MAFPLIMTTGLCNRPGAAAKASAIRLCFLDWLTFVGSSLKLCLIRLSGFSSSSIESKLRISSSVRGWVR